MFQHRSFVEGDEHAFRRPPMLRHALDRNEVFFLAPDCAPFSLDQENPLTALRIVRGHAEVTLSRAEPRSVTEAHAASTKSKAFGDCAQRSGERLAYNIS